LSLKQRGKKREGEKAQTMRAKKKRGSGCRKEFKPSSAKKGKKKRALKPLSPKEKRERRTQARGAKEGEKKGGGKGGRGGDCGMPKKWRNRKHLS